MRQRLAVQLATADDHDLGAGGPLDRLDQ